MEQAKIRIAITNIDEIIRNYSYEDHHRLKHHRDIFNDLSKTLERSINIDDTIPLRLTIDYEKENDIDFFLFTLNSASYINGEWVLTYTQTYDSMELSRKY